MTPGILPFALRVRLRRFKIAPGDFVEPLDFIACIEDFDVIEKILAHLDAKASEPEALMPPPFRAPPQQGLFDETG